MFSGVRRRRRRWFLQQDPLLTVEDQANASGIVRDVGIIRSLTRCRSGLEGMVATRAGYRAGRRSVLAILPDRCPLNPCHGRGQARLFAYMCRALLRSAVALRSQTGLTANLQGFRIGAPEGWPLLQSRPSGRDLRCRHGTGRHRVRCEPSRRRCRTWRVNGQVAVPAGGQVKVPTPRVDQVLFRVVPPLARASRMR
jgi:hypothetical protein